MNTIQSHSWKGTIKETLTLTLNPTPTPEGNVQKVPIKSKNPTKMYKKSNVNVHKIQCWIFRTEDVGFLGPFLDFLDRDSNPSPNPKP